MDAIRISLLGPPELQTGARALPLGKPAALLAYLYAEHGRRHARDTLAHLLWSDSSPSAARLNLRQALHQLRKQLPAGLLQHDRDWVWLAQDPPSWVDLHEFERLGPQLQRSADPAGLFTRADTLYRGDLLENLVLRNAGQFEQWLEARRQQLQATAMRLFQMAVTYFRSRNEPHRALHFCDRHLGLNPWNETVVRCHLELLAQTGQSHLARERFHRFATALRSELGVEPEAQTRAMAERIAAPANERQPAASAERRPVTVLCCVVSATANVPDEELLGALEPVNEQLRAQLDVCGGFLVSPHGGATFAYFGYPLAREDAAAAAVNAAFNARECAAQNGHPNAGIRCGLHSGWVISGDAPPRPDAVGRISDLALRLAHAAGSGGIVASEAVSDLVRRHGRLPTQRVFHIDDAQGRVKALELARRPNAEPPPMGAAFVGRQSELARLNTAWEAARGGAGALLGLSADAGGGKTRLLHRFSRPLRERSAVAVYDWRCLPAATARTFFPVLEWLRGECGVDEGETPGPGQVQALFDQCVGVDTATRRTIRSLLEGGGDAADTGPYDLQSQARALVQWVLSAAAERPALLVAEDLHWADAGTLEVLRQIAEASRSRPLLALASVRGGHGDVLARLGEPPLIELAPLAPSEARELVSAVRGAPLPHPHLERIVDQADGIPLFIEELARTSEVGGDGDIPLPNSLGDLLAARLDAVGGAKSLAQALSPVRQPFDLMLLQALHPSDFHTALQRLEALIDADLVRPVDESDNLFDFKHALVREAAYRSLFGEHRRRAHARVAEALTTQLPERAALRPDIVAHHLEQAGEPLRAARFRLAAAKLAAKHLAPGEAQQHLDALIELLRPLPDDPERDELELAAQVQLGGLLVASAGYGAPATSAAFARARQLSARVGETPRLFDAVWGLWLGASTQSGYCEAKRLADKLLRIATASEDPQLLLAAHSALTNNHFWLLDLDTACEHFERAREHYGRSPGTDEQLWLRFGDHPLVTALSFRGWLAWYRGEADRAVDYCREALALARAIEHPHTQGFALTMLAMVHRFRGDTAQCLSTSTELLALSDRHALVMWQATGTLLQGWARLAAGESEGAEQMQAAGALIRDAMQGVEGVFLATIADGLTLAGDYTGAAAAIERSLALVESACDRHSEPELHRLRARALAAAGDIAGARREATVALELSRRHGVLAHALRAATELAELDPDRHDAAAYRVLRELLSAFHEGFDTADLRKAQAVLEGNP